MLFSDRFGENILITQFEFQSLKRNSFNDYELVSIKFIKKILVNKEYSEGTIFLAKSLQFVVFFENLYENFFKKIQCLFSPVNSIKKKNLTQKSDISLLPSSISIFHQETKKNSEYRKNLSALSLTVLNKNDSLSMFFEILKKDRAFIRISGKIVKKREKIQIKFSSDLKFFSIICKNKTKIYKIKTIVEVVEKLKDEKKRNKFSIILLNKKKLKFVSENENEKKEFLETLKYVLMIKKDFIVLPKYHE